jgi:hypothetical protein
MDTPSPTRHPVGGLAGQLDQIHLEEVDGEEVVVRITATPEHPADGPELASEVLEAIASHDRAGTG